MSDREIDLLASVLAETEATIASVRPGQAALATPCPEYDVARLVDHLVGWAQSFATRLSGGSDGRDPQDFVAGDAPAAEFGQAARSIVGSYREATEQSDQLPLGMLIMEFLTHGWDLAVATGHTMAFDPDAAALALDTGKQILAPEYRGDGKAFGVQVEVADTAGALDQLVAFMGRDPSWKAASLGT